MKANFFYIVSSPGIEPVILNTAFEIELKTINSNQCKVIWLQMILRPYLSLPNR